MASVTFAGDSQSVQIAPLSTKIDAYQNVLWQFSRRLTILDVSSNKYYKVSHHD